MFKICGAGSPTEKGSALLVAYQVETLSSLAPV